MKIIVFINGLLDPNIVFCTERKLFVMDWTGRLHTNTTEPARVTSETRTLQPSPTHPLF